MSVDKYRMKPKVINTSKTVNIKSNNTSNTLKFNNIIARRKMLIEKRRKGK